MWIADAKVIKFIDVRHIFVEIVHLIDYQHHWLMRTTQHICHLGICIHQALLYIYQENDHICCCHGDLRLGTHLGKNDIIAVRLDTSCVDQGKRLVKPCDICIYSVPGDARGIFYN